MINNFYIILHFWQFYLKKIFLLLWFFSNLTLEETARIFSEKWNKDVNRTHIARIKQNFKSMSQLISDDFVAALAEDQREFELERAAHMHRNLEANVQRAFNHFLDLNQSQNPNLIQNQSPIDGGMISDASDDVKNSISSGNSSSSLIPVGHATIGSAHEPTRHVINPRGSFSSVISEPIIEIDNQENNGFVGRRKNSVIQPNPIIKKNRMINTSLTSTGSPEPIMTQNLPVGNQVALNPVMTHLPAHLVSHGHHVHSHHHHHHHHHVKLTTVAPDHAAHTHGRRPLTPPPVYRCPQCPKLFESPHDFWLHLRVDHFNALFQLSKLQMGGPQMGGTPLSTSPMPTNSPTSSFTSLSHQMH